MKNSTRLLILLVAGLFMFSTAVYAGNDAPRTGFVDLNGDGINDNAKDDDADGIPNSLDADFLKSEDGSNSQNTNQSKEQFKEYVELRQPQSLSEAIATYEEEQYLLDEAIAKKMQDIKKRYDEVIYGKVTFAWRSAWLGAGLSIGGLLLRKRKV